MKNKKYLKYGDEFYRLLKISFFYWTAEVQQTTLTEHEVSEKEVFDASGIQKLTIIVQKSE